MHLKFFALAVVLSALAPVRAQEPDPTPPVEVTPQSTQAVLAQEAPSDNAQGAQLVAPEAPREITAPLWQPFECPRGIRFYPREAQQQRVEGLATLDCLVADNGSLQCEVATEEPAGYGFGEAAIRIASCRRMQTLDSSGAPTAGGRYRLRMPFRLQ